MYCGTAASLYLLQCERLNSIRHLLSKPQGSTENGGPGLMPDGQQPPNGNSADLTGGLQRSVLQA